MGFDLSPRNKKAGQFHMGAFSWHWMLDNGVGLPLGYGRGYKPAQFVYRNRPDGLSVGYNDGARVSSKEAKQMAMVAKWLADYQDTLEDMYAKETEEKRTEMQQNHHQIYNLPVRRDFVELTRKFSEWASKSGGFRVW